MASPQLKRPRQADDVGRGEEVKRVHTNGHASPRADDRDRRNHMKHNDSPFDRKATDRSGQSRSRERHERRTNGGRDGEHRRERSRERGGERRERNDTHRHKDGGDHERRGNERHGPRRDDRRRSRSRSPTSKRREDHRQRSPPRGPRSNRSPTRASAYQDSRHLQSGPPASRPSASNRANTERQSIRNGAVRLDPARPAKTEEELEEMMREAMGFGDFKTTKDTKVPGNDKLYAVRKEKKTEYRQYMNRVGGFNRPLSPTREP